MLLLVATTIRGVYASDALDEMLFVDYMLRRSFKKGLKSAVKTAGTGILEGAGTSILGSLTSGSSDSSDNSTSTDNTQRPVCVVYS